MAAGGALGTEVGNGEFAEEEALETVKRTGFPFPSSLSFFPLTPAFPIAN